jgi:hypothetical protein
MNLLVTDLELRSDHEEVGDAFAQSSFVDVNTNELAKWLL